MMTIAKKRGVALSLAAGTLAGLLLAGFARAGEHRYHVDNAKYKSECGSCHIAYPPALLPAASWSRLMAGLDKHFGSDASLDAQTAQEIGRFLGANAGTRSKLAADAGSLRITESRWFRHEHGEELSPAVWKNPKVKSPANCEACHTEAAQGDYGERSLRLPR